MVRCGGVVVRWWSGPAVRGLRRRGSGARQGLVRDADESWAEREGEGRRSLYVFWSRGGGGRSAVLTDSHGLNSAIGVPFRNGFRPCFSFLSSGDQWTSKIPSCGTPSAV